MGNNMSLSNSVSKSNHSQLSETDRNVMDSVSRRLQSDIYTQNELDGTLDSIEDVATQISNMHRDTMVTNSEISDLEKQLETRNRMLQLTMEKNIYKRKMIFTLLAVILLLIVLMGASYFYLR